MKKLIKWLKWFDDNLIHISLLAFIVLISVLPKFPIRHVEYTYIRIRIDDLLPAIISIIFLVQWIRRKIKLNTKFLIPILLFWAAVFTSYIIGAYGQNTIAVNSIGLMHSFRRIQYMLIFFIASSAVSTDDHFKKYMKWYLVTVLVVVLYGFGQKFLSFPSIQSMNPAYVDGRLLILNPEDRINSTFGGHFDLAAYLTFSMPILLGFYFAFSQIRYFVTFFLSIIILLFTAARSSFAAYLLSVHGFLLYSRKFKMAVAVFILTVLLTLITGDMLKRFQSLFQIKTVYVNESTGSTQIGQKISTKELPAGGYNLKELPIIGDVITKQSGAGATQASPDEIKAAAIHEAVEEAKQSGKPFNGYEIEKRASEISKFIKPEKSVLCDISCATRLQIEWPRAIGAFLYNPIFGSGPSSITEATDNDFLRWLGETGLIGTGIFLWIIFAICNFVRHASKQLKPDERMIFKGFIFGVIALLINGLYIDVFEASKVAYNFWLVAGLYTGVSTTLLANKSKKLEK